MGNEERNEDTLAFEKKDFIPAYGCWNYYQRNRKWTSLGKYQTVQTGLQIWSLMSSGAIATTGYMIAHGGLDAVVKSIEKLF